MRELPFAVMKFMFRLLNGSSDKQDLRLTDLNRMLNQIEGGEFWDMAQVLRDSIR